MHSLEMKASSWLLALRGIVGLLLGLYLISNPFKGALIFAFLFGFYVIFDGLTAGFSALAFKREGAKYWWLEVVEGILKVVLGLVMVFFPVGTAVTLVLFIQITFAIYAIIGGLSLMAGAFSLANGFLSKVLWLVAGIFITMLGFTLAIRPLENTENFIIAIGAFNVLVGIMFLIGAMIVRQGADEMDSDIVVEVVK